MLVGDASKIDFPDGSCGAVIAMGVLEYLTIDQIRQTLKEIYRVLRPDGVTILTIPKRYNWGRVVLAALYPIRKTIRWRPSHENVKLEKEKEVHRLDLIQRRTFALGARHRNFGVGSVSWLRCICDSDVVAERCDRSGVGITRGADLVLDGSAVCAHRARWRLRGCRVS